MLRKDIHMLGDSTMCFYTNDRKPRTGWGMKLQPLCHDDIRVRNYAMAGYSTRNFQNTGYFEVNTFIFDILSVVMVSEGIEVHHRAIGHSDTGVCSEETVVGIPCECVLSRQKLVIVKAFYVE